MSNLLYRMHRFFRDQLIYPLLLSTVLALATYFARVLLSDNLNYRNLVWNLFLAWLPYIFSVWAAALHRLAPRWWILLLPPAALWLIFFPNAAYILTDFLHLEERAYIPLWFDILLLSMFAWTGIFLTIASLKTMQDIVRSYLGGLLSWLFVAVALGMSGLGIYLGRFERWNSWDLLIHPRSILADVLARFINPLNNLRFFGFTILFTAFLLVVYLMFISVRQTGQDDE